MSGQATIEMAVKATRLGAIDFLEKPISTDKLLLTVENALRLRHLEEENRDLKRRLGRHRIVWASAAMRDVMAQVETWRRAKRASAFAARRERARN